MSRQRHRSLWPFVAAAVALTLAAPRSTIASGDSATAEDRRVVAAARAAEPTIALFEQKGDNGGSGVVVTADGYAVTNFHVVAPCGPRVLAATSDGRLHDAVIVGIDPTGDVALVKLLGDGPFAAATWGDSGGVRVGDGAMVLGNPFLLADDFRPTLTCGVISGVGRYQEPAGSLLEYADCLQTDAAINPGNSGGPLFDASARLIGINGRGSFEKRGRVNVGIGYAVSSNQVQRFLPLLRSGRVVDHGALGATVRTIAGGAPLVDAVDTSSDAYRRGLRPGDEVESIGGREVRTANDVLNAIGVLPEGWRTVVAWRRGD
ncbi:MAG: S1C family serine protease, partial [Lacipirellulaceae bacterium]